MKKTKYAILAATTLYTATSQADEISFPTEGVMEHVVYGRVAAPTVRWIDRAGFDQSNMGGTIDAADVIGELEVTLPGSALTERGVLLSSSCSGGETSFKFKLKGNPAGTITGDNGMMIVGTPERPAGWTVWDFTGPDAQVQNRIDEGGVLAWHKTGVSTGDVLSIKVTGNAHNAIPGVYTATYL